MWGKLKFKVLRKVHISGLFQTILSKILLNFPKKSSQSSAYNLQSFEVSSASENEPKMKTKLDLWTKIFEDLWSFVATLLWWPLQLILVISKPNQKMHIFRGMTLSDRQKSQKVIPLNYEFLQLHMRRGHVNFTSSRIVCWVGFWGNSIILKTKI